MLAQPIRYLRILAELARVGIVRKSQLQLEFWCQVIMDCLWYASHVAVFEVLYLHVPSIAGWSRADFRVLLGFLFASDAFMMIWLTQLWRFGRDLKEGKLDPFRVRPASMLVVYGFQQFSPEGCVNMLFALGYLSYGVWNAVPDPSPWTGLALAGCIALCWWSRLVIVTLFGTLEIALVGSDVMRFLSELFLTASDRPLDIFGARLKAFLIYIVPVGAVTHVPAAMMLGRYTALEALGTVLWLIALGILVIYAWHRSFRHYESAMG
jgi:ABC-2 type transport system permease protein